MNTPVTFLDFSTEEKYRKLQTNFFAQDERNGAHDWEGFKVQKKDFKIVIKRVNSATQEEDYKELSFQNDFLILSIDSMAERFIIDFKRALDQKPVLGKINIELFAKRYLGKLVPIGDTISNSVYLDDNIKVKLHTQITAVFDYLENAHINPNYYLSDKIKFNLHKTDVLVLFLLLREYKFIKHPHDSDLGRLIDNFFQYFDHEKKEFINISNSRKVLNDIKNGSRTIENSLERLKQIFTDNLFYIFPK